MVRQARIARLVAAAGATAIAAALALTLMPTAANAEAKASAPAAVQITGAGVPDKIIIEQAKQPRLFSSLLQEVDWLATATPQTGEPKADKLGPKYTAVVVSKGGAPTQTYDVYPSAAGGPRAHRPARQPDGRKVADGWFYGRLTMSETLRVSGVPLQAKPDVVNGGIGGGIGEKIDVPQLDPVSGVNDLLEEMRRILLVNGAVMVLILAGLAGIAYLIRRRI